LEWRGFSKGHHDEQEHDRQISKLIIQSISFYIALIEGTPKPKNINIIKQSVNLKFYKDYLTRRYQEFLRILAFESIDAPTIDDIQYRWTRFLYDTTKNNEELDRIVSSFEIYIFLLRLNE
jgi:hypothetical protein